LKWQLHLCIILYLQRVYMCSSWKADWQVSHANVRASYCIVTFVFYFPYWFFPLISWIDNQISCCKNNIQNQHPILHHHHSDSCVWKIIDIIFLVIGSWHVNFIHLLLEKVQQSRQTVPWCKRCFWVVIYISWYWR